MAHFTPVLETQSLVVTPDLLPISDEFHLLISSKDHRHAFASSPDLNGELTLIVEELESRLGPIILIEHGGVDGQGANGRASVQSIDHRHIHVLPAYRDLLPVLSAKLSDLALLHELIEIADSSPLAVAQLTELATRRVGYIYAHSAKEGMALIAPDKQGDLPSQLSQRTLAPLLGKQTVNWKELPEDVSLQAISAERIQVTIERCQI